MSKRTLSVTVDGQTFSRTTAADYTHVVIARHIGKNDGEVVTWSKSETNARAAKNKAEGNKFNKGCEFEVLPLH